MGWVRYLFAGVSKNHDNGILKHLKFVSNNKPGGMFFIKKNTRSESDLSESYETVQSTHKRCRKPKVSQKVLKKNWKKSPSMTVALYRCRHFFHTLSL